MQVERYNNVHDLYKNFEILETNYNKKDGLYIFNCYDPEANTTKIILVDADIVEKFNLETTIQYIEL
jgi:hypothetical protein